MPSLQELINCFENIIPPALAEEWDNCGFQAGDSNKLTENILVTLDPSPEIVKIAEEKNCGLIITHHPLFFKDVRKLDFNSDKGKVVMALAKNGTGLYSAHTNLDKAERGFNEVFTGWLGLKNTLPVCGGKSSKIVTFVPPGDTEKVLNALSQAGAGRIGNYAKASFRVRGTGTFEALKGASPAVGEAGFNEVEEDRLEMQFDSSLTDAVISALKDSHPYEEPAFDIYERSSNSQSGIGIAGDLGNPLEFEALIGKVKKDLGFERISYSGDLKKEISKIAIVPGSGSGYKVSADVLISGDIGHHAFRESSSFLIDAGHFELENFALKNFCDTLAKEFRKKFPEVGIIYEKGPAPRLFY